MVGATLEMRGRRARFAAIGFPYLYVAISCLISLLIICCDIMWQSWFLGGGVIVDQVHNPSTMVDEAAERISPYAMNEYVRRFFRDVEDARE